MSAKFQKDIIIHGENKVPDLHSNCGLYSKGIHRDPKFSTLCEVTAIVYTLLSPHAFCLNSLRLSFTTLWRGIEASMLSPQGSEDACMYICTCTCTYTPYRPECTHNHVFPVNGAQDKLSQTFKL